MESDPAVVDKHWSNAVDSWYVEGRNGPNLCVLRFELDDAEVWTVHPGIKGMFKLLTDNKVDPEEMGDHQKVAL